MSLLFRPFIIVLFFHQRLAFAFYNGTACCLLANDTHSFINNSLPLGAVCGQQYSPNIPAAPSLLIPYAFCKANCGWIGLSQLDSPDQWAAPIVQFVLPAVIFSMTIPRRKKWEWHYFVDPSIRSDNKVLAMIIHLWRLGISLFSAVGLLIPIVVDTIVWIAMIILGAGYMMIEGLYEALLDYRIMEYLTDNHPHPTSSSHDPTIELLVTVVAGNLLQGEEFGEPQINIAEKIRTSENYQRRTRFLALLSAQMSFGSIVGAPVLFYLGAFVYTILDLRNRPSNQDAAISLAFGVEWMIIVHVAIISGCLLASNNPSASSALVGIEQPGPRIHRQFTHQRFEDHKDIPIGSLGTRFRQLGDLFRLSNAYETPYQPVSMWSRGSNKMTWVRKSASWNSDNPTFREHIRIRSRSWLLLIFLPTCVLIVLPPTAGAVVAYSTPPVGFGCRSLSFICYAGAQVILAILATWKAASEHHQTTFTDFGDSTQQHPTSSTGEKARQWTSWLISPLLVLICTVSMIGGTIMQVMGVFRNCLCYVNAPYWLDLDNSPGIDVASDTDGQRKSSDNWIRMGATATIFMAVCCYVGWWYQRLIRKQFCAQVEALYQSGLRMQQGRAPNPQQDGSTIELVTITSAVASEATATGIQSPMLTSLPQRRTF